LPTSAAWRWGLARDFGKLIADETEKWAKVVKFSGAKPVVRIWHVEVRNLEDVRD
jgi:hypothetical protein